MGVQGGKTKRKSTQVCKTFLVCGMSALRITRKLKASCYCLPCSGYYSGGYTQTILKINVQSVL